MRIHIMLIALIIFGAIISSGATIIAADDRNMGSSLTISGVGLIDTSLEVNTNGHYSE
jgi:hypothetical protein